MDNHWKIIVVHQPPPFQFGSNMFQPHPRARQLVGLQCRCQLLQNLEGSAPVVFTNASHGHAKTYGTRFQEGLVWQDGRTWPDCQLNWNSCILELDIKTLSTNRRIKLLRCAGFACLTRLHLKKMKAKRLTKLLKKLRCHGPNVVSATGTTSGIESHLWAKQLPYSPAHGHGTSTQVLLFLPEWAHKRHINGTYVIHCHTSSRNGEDNRWSFHWFHWF